MCFAKVYLQIVFIFEVFLTLVALDNDDEESGLCVSSILGLSLSAMQMVEPPLRPQNPHPAGSQARNQPLLRPQTRNNDRILTLTRRHTVLIESVHTKRLHPELNFST